MAFCSHLLFIMQLLINKLMVGKLMVEGCLWMLSVGGLFQIGDLAALGVGLVLLELEVEKLMSDIPGGSWSNCNFFNDPCSLVVIL